MLTGYTFILFECLNEENKAKIVFWASILAITDVQVTKTKKLASLSFFEDTENKNID